MDPKRCRLCDQEKAILFNRSPIPKEDYKRTILCSLQIDVLKDDNTKSPFICMCCRLTLDRWHKKTKSDKKKQANIKINIKVPEHLRQQASPSTPDKEPSTDNEQVKDSSSPPSEKAVPAENEPSPQFPQHTIQSPPFFQNIIIAARTYSYSAILNPDGTLLCLKLGADGFSIVKKVWVSCDGQWIIWINGKVIKSSQQSVLG